MENQKISYAKWAKDEEAEFPSGYFYRDDLDEFVKKLNSYGITTEVGLETCGDETTASGELFLTSRKQTGDVWKGVLEAIVKERPDECSVEDDGTIRLWWD